MLKMARGVVEDIMFFPDRNSTFFDLKDFPWVSAVETEWKTVRQELEALLVRREEIPNFQDLSEAEAAY